MRQNISKYTKKWHYFATASLLALSTALLSTDYQKQSLYSVTTNNDAEDSITVVENPAKTISYVTDTLYSGTPTLLYYMNNSITRNYYENANSYRMQLPYFAHEDWHHHNALSQFRTKYFLSPSEYRRLCMHDEISANLIAIQTASLEYQVADDKDAVMKKYENTYMKFYFDAIKDGTIKLDSNAPEDIEARNSFLVNGTMNMWKDKFRKQYSPRQMHMLNNFISRVGLHKSHPKSYNKLLSHMYTIGGVDFSKYIKEDITPPEEIISIFDEMGNVKAFTQNKQETTFILNEVANNFGKLREFDASQRLAVFQHILISAKLKYELKKLDNYALSYNAPAISAAYNKVMYTFVTDKTYNKFIENCRQLMPVNFATDFSQQHIPTFKLPQPFTESDRAKLAQIYTYRQKDLTQYISSFDMNKFPDDFFLRPEIVLTYTSSPNLYNLIITQPKSCEAVASDEHNDNIEKSAITLQEKTTPVSTPIKKRRLSDSLYVELPDFSQPLLVPEAMTKENWTQLKKLYRDFDNIPNVFKLCNTEAQNQYIKENGNPHYFESKTDPYRSKKDIFLQNSNSQTSPKQRTIIKKDSGRS